MYSQLHYQRDSKSHFVSTKQRKVNDVLNRGQEGGRGYFTVLRNSLADARECTLSALYAFASRGQRFERKSSEKPKKSKMINANWPF